MKVKITGGLGNQLFKFFNALRIANMFNSDLVLDISWYSHQNYRHRKITPRKFEIDFFPEISRFVTKESDFAGLDKWIEIFEKRLTRKYQDIFSIYCEGNAWYKSKAPRVVYGNFEKLKYLPSKEIISKMLYSNVLQTPKLLNVVNELKRDDVIVFHIRRGDYLNLTNVYDLLGIDYYEAGLKHVLKSSEIRKICIFTDSPDVPLPWLKDLPIRSEIVGTQFNLNSAETLLAMSYSRNLICANSTFSWWSAYLGTINSRTTNVVIPSRFNKIPGDTTTEDLFLADWTCITPEGLVQIPSNFA